jgi:hypothetical protein
VTYRDAAKRPTIDSEVLLAELVRVTGLDPIEAAWRAWRGGPGSPVCGTCGGSLRVEMNSYGWQAWEPTIDLPCRHGDPLSIVMGR